MDLNKKMIIRIGAVFVCILLFLTFFSSTIYNFNLPNVVVSFSHEGSVSKYAESRGVVEFRERELYYSGEAGRITLLVAEGEAVAAGDCLFSIETDTEDLQRLLDERQRTEDRLDLRLERLGNDREYVQAAIRNLSPSTDGALDTFEFDYEIHRLETLIDTVEKELDDLRVLFEIGAASQREIDEKEATLDDFRSQVERQEHRKAAAVENHNKSVEDSAMQYRNRLSELQRILTDLDFEIDDTSVEAADNRSEIDKLAGRIESGGVATASAESPGIVREISPGVETGAVVSGNQLVMKIGSPDGGFTTTIFFPDDVDYLGVGDLVDLSVRSRGVFGIRGAVSSLAYEGGRLKAGIQFISDQVSFGETVTARIDAPITMHDTLISNRALREDDMGPHILYIEMERGFFGPEYYVRRARARVLAQDNRNAAVFLMATQDRPSIIINSDKPITEGDRVRIVSGYD